MEKNLDLIACTPARYRRFSRKRSWASKETRARGLVRSASLSRAQKPNGIVFSSGVNYLHSEGNIQPE